MWKGHGGKGFRQQTIMPAYGQDGDPYSRGYRPPQPRHGEKALTSRMSIDMPPAWGPEMHDYPLRAFKQDLNIWLMACTVVEERHGPLLLCQLHGVAKSQAES